MPKQYTLYQILVLCGTREEKHNKRIPAAIGKTENFISTWPTRGIPPQYWGLVAEMSECTLDQIADAQAFALKTDYAFEMQRYSIAMQGRSVDKT